MDVVKQKFRDEEYLKAAEQLRKHIPVKLKTNFSEEYLPYFEVDGKLTSLESEVVYLASLFDLTKIEKLDSVETQGLYRHWVDCLHKYCTDKLDIKSKDELSDLRKSLLMRLLSNKKYKKDFILSAVSKPELYSLIRWHYACIGLDIGDEDLLIKSFTIAFAYLLTLKYKIHKVYTKPTFGLIVDDPLAKIYCITYLTWLRNNNNLYVLTNELKELIDEFIGDNWEDNVRKLSNCDSELIDIYFDFKKLTEHKDVDDCDINDIKALYKRYNTYLKNNGELLDKLYIDADEESSPEVPLDTTLRKDYSQYVKKMNTDVDENITSFINKLASDKYAGFSKLLTHTQVILLNMALEQEYERDGFKKVLALKNKEAEDARAKVKDKERSFKKTLSKETDKVTFYKEKVSKLTKELSKSSSDNVKVLEGCIDVLEEDIASLNSTIEIKDAEIKSLEEQLDALTQQRNEAEAELLLANTKLEDIETNDEGVITSGSRNISTDALCEAIKHKKILLVGGNVIHSRLKEKHLNNIEYIKAGDMNFNIAGKKYDLVVIYTKLVNHSTTEKLDSQLHNSDIPIIRFNEAGLTSFIHCLFNYIYGGDEKAYGMYKA